MGPLKTADELVLLTEEETVLQGTRVVERGFGCPTPPPTNKCRLDKEIYTKYER